VLLGFFSSFLFFLIEDVSTLSLQVLPSVTARLWSSVDMPDFFCLFKILLTLRAAHPAPEVFFSSFSIFLYNLLLFLFFPACFFPFFFSGMTFWF